MRRLAVGLAVAVAVAALAAGHLWFWYGARPRPARPDPASPVAGLLGDASFPAALWLPYPHQNLGALDPGAPEHQRYLAACARLSGLPPPVLPTFGGFAVVPSSELALAADARGERFVVVARVYPLIARFSRLAGRLADNAWLAGGPVTVDGRAAEVRWQGDLWIVQAAGAPVDLAGPPPAAATAAPALGVLALSRAAEPFPADVYRLEADDRRIQVRSAAPLPDGLWRRAEAVRGNDLVLLTLAGPGSADGVQALAFFRRPGASTDLPRAATLASVRSPPPQPWRVPGGSLARLADALRSARTDGFEIIAIGDPGIERARAVAPLAAAVAGTAGEAAEGELVWGLWADLAHAYGEVSRLAALGERLPLVPRRDARRFRDARAVLAPVAARFDRLAVVVSNRPSALRLELQRRAVRAAADPDRD